MRSVTYHPRIKQADTLYGLAEKATRRLDEIVGPEAHSVEAEWDRTEDDKGRPLATLKIRDLPEEAQTSLGREDLEDSSMLRSRLARLWGNLLQARLHRLLREFRTDDGPGSN